MEELNENILKEKVDTIIHISGDAEGAHSSEDKLHVEIINQFCPDWVKLEVKRLSDSDFPRWCA